MHHRPNLKYGVLSATGTAIAVGAGLYQLRKAPISNSWYVALGSSYAAGLGLGARAPGSSIISQRSVNGYPQQPARLLKVPSFTDMTSSGSTVQHVLRGGQMMLAPQIDALGQGTRLVTLTAGGNDIGYVGDLITMAYRNRGGIVGAAINAFWKGPKSALERDFAALNRNLRATLREIGRRSPDARIVVVTYPVIFPDRGACPAVGITATEAEVMRAVGDKLAQTTRAAAVDAGSTLIDMAVLSAGHDACGSEPWVNGFKPEKGADFHPTLAGARATAEAIADVLGRPANS